jgi:hypothetical protein
MRAAVYRRACKKDDQQGKENPLQELPGFYKTWSWRIENDQVGRGFGHADRPQLHRSFEDAGNWNTSAAKECETLQKSHAHLASFVKYQLITSKNVDLVSQARVTSVAGPIACDERALCSIASFS